MGLVAVKSVLESSPGDAEFLGDGPYRMATTVVFGQGILQILFRIVYHGY